MGIYIESKMIYGMRYARLVEHLSEEIIEELNESLDDGDVEYASPYYDSPRDCWFVGYELVQDFDSTGVRTFLDSLEEAEKHFKNRFGVTGIVRACKHVC